MIEDMSLIIRKLHPNQAGEPAYTFEKGIQETIEWYLAKQNGQKISRQLIM